MEILSHNRIQEEIACWMMEPGVQIAMKQGSVSFENFIQIKLAGFLEDIFKKKCFIKIESYDKKYQADILVFSENSDKARPIAAFQLKIVALNSRLSSVKMKSKDKSGVLDDIDKLLLDLGSCCRRILICVVYQFECGNVKFWGQIKGTSTKGEDYRMEIISKLPEEHRNKHCDAPALVSFGNKAGCVDIFSF